LAIYSLTERKVYRNASIPTTVDDPSANPRCWLKWMPQNSNMMALITANGASYHWNVAKSDPPKERHKGMVKFASELTNCFHYTDAKDALCITGATMYVGMAASTSSDEKLGWSTAASGSGAGGKVVKRQHNHFHIQSSMIKKGSRGTGARKNVANSKDNTGVAWCGTLSDGKFVTITCTLDEDSMPHRDSDAARKPLPSILLPKNYEIKLVHIGANGNVDSEKEAVFYLPVGDMILGMLVDT
jgi:hypothetical protein